MNHNIIATIFAISLIALSTIFASIANAAPTSDGPRAKMHKIDVDGDGKISREEASKYKGVAKVFDRVDTNKDGYLAKDEMQLQQAKRTEIKLKAIDGNNDGRISRAEADATAPKLAKNFDKLDTNKDGFIDKQEMAAARQHRQR